MNALARLSRSFKHKPVTTAALVFLAVVAFAVLQEFAQGFFDGLVAGFTDGI